MTSSVPADPMLRVVLRDLLLAGARHFFTLSQCQEGLSL